MQEKRIEKIIKGIEDIPTLPYVVFRINNALGNDSVTTNAVSEIIEKDPSLTSRVLRLANSSYYGLSCRVDTIPRAITVLGFNTIRNLAFTTEVFKIFNKNISLPLDIKGLWYHSLGCAIASKSLIHKNDPILEEKVFICGILHDIGKIIIAQNIPDLLEEVLKEIKDNRDLTLCDAEKNIIGYTHSEVGSLVAEKWHFPKELSNIIRFHHSPSLVNPFIDISDYTLLHNAVYAGNQIAKAIVLGKSTDERVSAIHPSTRNSFGISEKELPETLFRIKLDFDSVVNSWELE
ncbi:MAG: HDOD domain-containing protein [Nitrospirota bacterium]